MRLTAPNVMWPAVADIPHARSDRQRGSFAAARGYSSRASLGLSGAGAVSLFRPRPPPESLELIGGKSLDAAAVGLELLPRRQGHLHSGELRVERTHRRSGVDVNHGCDLLRDAVARAVAGDPCPAVNGEHDGSPRRADHLADRIDVIRHGDR